MGGNYPIWVHLRPPWSLRTAVVWPQAKGPGEVALGLRFRERDMVIWEGFNIFQPSNLKKTCSSSRQSFSTEIKLTGKFKKWWTRKRNPWNGQTSKCLRIPCLPILWWLLMTIHFRIPIRWYQCSLSYSPVNYCHILRMMTIYCKPMCLLT